MIRLICCAGILCSFSHPSQELLRHTARVAFPLQPPFLVLSLLII